MSLFHSSFEIKNKLKLTIKNKFQKTFIEFPLVYNYFKFSYIYKNIHIYLKEISIASSKTDRALLKFL